MIPELVNTAAEVSRTEDIANWPVELKFHLNIKHLILTVRSEKCLTNAKIFTVGELVTKTAKKLLRIKNMGKKSLKDIEEALQEIKLQLVD